MSVTRPTQMQLTQLPKCCSTLCDTQLPIYTPEAWPVFQPSVYACKELACTPAEHKAGESRCQQVASKEITGL